MTINKAWKNDLRAGNGKNSMFEKRPSSKNGCSITPVNLSLTTHHSRRKSDGNETNKLLSLDYSCPS